jgi:hypothetical protein
LRVHAHHVVSDPAGGATAFFLELSRPPDFSLTDEYGRQADGFQIYIDTAADHRPFSEFHLNCVLRGTEIFRAPGELRIRNAAPPSDDPDAGGWGATRGTVPYTLDGSQIAFSVPFALLRETDGRFNYRWEVYEFGATADLVQGQSLLVPDPAVGLVPFGALVCLVVIGRRRPPAAAAVSRRARGSHSPC